MMPAGPSAAAFLQELQLRRSDEELKKYERFFPVDRRGDDIFLGVRMGTVFALAKDHVAMSLGEIETLLESPIHEARVGAVSIMDFQARSKTTSEEHRAELYRLYLRRHDRINTWDLVDRSCIHVVGRYLYDKTREKLDELALSSFMPERRTAIVSTLYFVSQGDLDDTWRLAATLVQDGDEGIHKAVGWALRSAGGPGLLTFLDQHAASMPRLTLRAALENQDQATKTRYLNMKKGPHGKA